MKRCFRILAVVGLFSFVQSAHSGKTDEQVEIEKQVNQVPSKMVLFKEAAPSDFPIELMRDITGALYFVTKNYETHTGARFRYIAPGEYADASLGEGRMDEDNFIWFAPPRKNGELKKKVIEDALDQCESYTLKNQKPERLVHVPKLERFQKLATYLGFGKEGGYQPLGFFSFLAGHVLWTSTATWQMYFNVFNGDTGDKNDSSSFAYTQILFLCGVEAGEITILRDNY